MHSYQPLAVGLLVLTAAASFAGREIARGAEFNPARKTNSAKSASDLAAIRHRAAIGSVIDRRNAKPKPAVGTGVRKVLSSEPAQQTKPRIAKASFDSYGSISNIDSNHFSTVNESAIVHHHLDSHLGFSLPPCCPPRYKSRLPLGHKLFACGGWLHSHKPDMTPHIPYRAMPADHYYFRPYAYQHIPFHQAEVVNYGLDPRYPYDNSFLSTIYDGLEDAEEIPPADPVPAPPMPPVEPATPADPASLRAPRTFSPPVRSSLPPPSTANLQSSVPSASQRPSRPASVLLRSHEVSIRSQQPNPLRSSSRRKSAK